MSSQTSPRTHRFADAILEHMPMAVAVYDPQDFRLLEANTLFLTIMDMFLDPSWRQGRIIGHPLTDWAHPTTISRLVTIFRSVAQTGIPYREGEFAFPTSRGDPTYWNWSVDRMRHHHGRDTHLLLTVTDVTAQVLARQASEQAHASLRQTTDVIEAERKRLAVIETVARSVRGALDVESIGRTAIETIGAAVTSLSVCIYTADPTQQTLHLLYTRPTTGTKETFVPSIPYDHSPLVAQAHLRQDPIIFENLQVTAASGVVSRTHPLVARGVRGYICMPLWFKDHFEGTLAALFAHTISSDGDEVKTLGGCATHIAAALAYSRLHSAVENERARLRAVLDQLPEGIILVDGPLGFVSYANTAAASILGFPVERIIGVQLMQKFQTVSVTDMNDRAILPQQYPIIRALQGETVSQEMALERPNGRKVVILCSATPLQSEQHDILGAICVFQDITERKSLEQQKNEFLSFASHELRTPITTIQGLAEILQLLSTSGQNLDSPRSLHAIAVMAEQSQRLTRLIEEMLDLSRIETARLELHLTPHDLVQVLVQVINSQAATTRRHDIRLAPDGLQASDSLIALFDEQRMVQVLSNLISNAIKYSPAGGEIEIGLRQELEQPDKAVIWVRDAGIGIPAGALPHIFKRFYRSSNLDHSMNGLGIGLYLVNEIITSHGGHVRVESVEGQGSTFYVILPLDNRQPRVV